MIDIINEKLESSFVIEDYFAIETRFSNYIVDDHYNYIYIKLDDYNLFELAFLMHNPYTLANMQLIICNNYSVINDNLDIPQNASEGVLQLKKPHRFEPELFHLDIYNNGAMLCFSNSIYAKIIKTGNVYFYVDNNMNICKIAISNLTLKDIEHIKYELAN